MEDDLLVNTDGVGAGETDALFDIPMETFDGRGQISSSLTDRYGISMFSDSFLSSEEYLKKSREEQYEQILADVMFNREQSSLDAAFRTVMEAGNSAVVKTEYDDRETTSSLTAFSYGILGMFLAGIVLFFIEKKRRKEKR